MGVVADLLAAIPAYTGLSPVSFFTILALLLALYYLLSGFFAPPPQPAYVPMEPMPPPVQLGEITEEELSAYNGSDPDKPLLLAIKGQIYDVSQSRMFYGPGGPYALFAGKDASRALAKTSFEQEDLTGDIEGLSAYERDTLQDWEWKFMSKYVKVGQIVNEKGKSRDLPVSDASDVPMSVENAENVEASGEVAKENGNLSEENVESSKEE